MDGLNELPPETSARARTSRALANAWDDLGTAVSAGPGAEPEALAEAVSRSGDRAVVGPRLLALLRAFADAPPAATEDRARMAALLTATASGALAAAFSAEGDAGARRVLALGLIQLLPPRALLRLLAGIGEAYRHPLSRPLAALLAKVLADAEALPDDVRPAGEEAFRALGIHTVERWAEGTFQTGAGSFADMFERGNGAAVGGTSTRVEPEPERVLAMALETGAMGSVVWQAVAELGEESEQVFDYLKRAPQGSRAADVITDHLATPTRLTAILKDEPVDFEAVDVLLRRMGAQASERLLDELAESHSRATRRGLLDRLGRLGPEVGGQVVERLGDERWFVARNMLHLLAELEADLSEVPVEHFAAHEDPRVRREAIQLLLGPRGDRTKGLVLALQDGDANLLRLGMKAAKSGFPEQAVPVLAKRVLEAEFPPELRVQSLYLLGKTTSALALEPLLRYAIGGKTLLGKPKLARKSPELLAALRGLARSWRHDKRAAALLQQATKSGDPDLENAAAGAPERDEESEA